MECSLGDILRIHLMKLLISLNPYSNGMLTWKQIKVSSKYWESCLNPYSNGMLTWNSGGLQGQDHSGS